MIILISKTCTHVQSSTWLPCHQERYYITAKKVQEDHQRCWCCTMCPVPGALFVPLLLLLLLLLLQGPI
jgi:hypothetical protein